MILISSSSGLYIMAISINDYNKLDVITNVKIVTPDSVIFPAVTICSTGHYSKDSYANNSLNKSEMIYDYSLLGNLIDVNGIYLKRQSYNVSDLEFFQTLSFRGHLTNEDYVRFNGHKNESVYFTIDSFNISIHEHFYKNISQFNYEKYTIIDSLRIFVSDNYIDSYFHSESFNIKNGRINEINIHKTLIENKLGKPYSPCDESLNRTYRYENCLSRYIHKVIVDLF